VVAERCQPVAPSDRGRPVTRRDQDLLAGSVGWRFSVHARDVVRRRGFDKEGVLLACVDPQVTYTAYNYGPGRSVHQRGHLAVVVDRRALVVVTVLLRTQQSWSDDDARRVNGHAA
jgi:hypothetical protein